MLKYKIEVIERDDGTFVLTGYIWTGPYTWKIDCMPPPFNSMKEVAKFLSEKYK